MTGGGPQLDLVVLVPGKNEQAIFDTLLSARVDSLGIRPIRHKTLVHPRRDPGCCGQARYLLKPFVRAADRALVVFDRHGCGQDKSSVEDIECEVRQQLASGGWLDRAEVVVIDPELESWVWSDSPEVDAALGWSGKVPSLRNWLVAERLWEHNTPKPADPKRALELALKRMRVIRSSAIYGELAREVSFHRCKDAAFNKLRIILQTWFGATGQSEPSAQSSGDNR